MVRRHRNAPEVVDRGAPERVMLGGADPQDSIPHRPLDQQFTEYLTEPELRAVRAVWWNLKAAGVDLPAERGVIALSGGVR